MAGVPWEGMVGVGAVADHNGRLQIDATQPIPSLSAALKQVSGGC